MELVKKKAMSFGALQLVFKMSALFALLRVMLAIVAALASSGFLALAVANFIDTAQLILAGGRQQSDIYMALVLLLVVLGVNTTIGSIIQLVDARIRLDVQRKMKPVLVRAQASLEFKHIENNMHWELITRVSRDPAV